MSRVLRRSTRNRSALQDVEGNTVQLPVTPVKAKRTRSALATPPTSTKKIKLQEAPVTLPPTPSKSPQRLLFGADSIYSKTKAALQRSSLVQATIDGHLPTRELQYQEITKFIQKSLANECSDSLYITGPPGTGKTAQVDCILKKHFTYTPVLPANQLSAPPELANPTYHTLPDGTTKTVVIVNINCIALNDPSTVFNKIYHACVTNPQPNKVKTMSDLREFLENYNKTTSFLVILDEMDKLATTAHNDTQATKTIFELFLLAKTPGIRVSLIGIANSLDMKDRFLSRLNLRRDLLPHTVLFPPYTAEEMCSIVTDRIASVDQKESIFQPMAIRFAAKKCASTAGDLRKLFDILRGSIENAELEITIARHKSKSPFLDDYEKPLLPKIGLQHVAKVFTQLMNSTSTKSRLHSLNMQQLTVLCSLTHRESIDIFQQRCLIDDAYDYYTRLLRKQDTLQPLKRSEFLESCNALETCGVVSIMQGRSHGKTKHRVKFIKTIVDRLELDVEISKYSLLTALLD